MVAGACKRRARASGPRRPPAAERRYDGRDLAARLSDGGRPGGAVDSPKGVGHFGGAEGGTRCAVAVRRHRSSRCRAHVRWDGGSGAAHCPGSRPRPPHQHSSTSVSTTDACAADSADDRAMTDRPMDGSAAPEGPGGRRPAVSRALTAGAKGAERVAHATGVDQALNQAVEEALVRALRSPAVIRAIERAIQEHATTAEQSSDEVAQAANRVLRSDAAGHVWAEVLESEQAQMLVERIARA